MTIEQQALARVQKARARLILERRFYGVLVSNVEPVISRRFPTAATDGKQHLWNPEFVMSLTDEELLFVQCHESEHDARHHGTRRGSRDPIEWNVSADFSINIDLVDERIGTPPKDALIDEQYRGMASEDIYRARALDKQQPQPQLEDDEGEEEQPSQPEDEAEDGDSGDAGDEDDGNEAGDESDSDDADGEGDSDEAGDKPGKGAGEGAGEQDGEGEGEGGGDAGDEAGEAGSGDGDGGKGEGKAEGGGQGEGAGDPGGCGQVIDAAEDANVRAEADLDWDKIVRQAASMAKAVGQLPGHVTREIERANNPPRDWRDELREFCEQGSLRIETWNRPNRRFAGQGLILPGSQRDGVSKAAFLIDTSGSMDDIALACVRDEAQALLDDGIINEIVVIYGDTEVTRVDEYTTGDEIVFDPKGGGGTDMKPLFDHVAEMFSDVTLIINFTDLEFYKDLGEEPAVPVLFAVHGYPNRVQTLMGNPPWGARCIDVGTH